ncbi:MAG TPA: MGMT family protein [Acidimicrobiales bacterium]|jgi:alkylated DNA nucleotide flippase Atl1|nr:MGMT family protein [Acidimicrobiales bacterium]
MTPLQVRIGQVVGDLQPGEVVSYQEVARRAGSAGAARAVGAFLAEHGAPLPWWRVVHKDGTLAAPNVRTQRRRLESEGVEFEAGRVLGGVA